MYPYQEALLVVLIVSVFAQISSALPQEYLAKTIEYENVNHVEDYHFKFSTANGIKREESGVQTVKENEPVLVVRGFYSYPSPDGKIYRVSYIADENGYRINPSNRLPTPVVDVLPGGGLG